MSELKPCPFCGGKGVFIKGSRSIHGDNPYTFAVHCAECRANNGEFFRTKEEAIAAWNRRAYERKAD